MKKKREQCQRQELCWCWSYKPQNQIELYGNVSQNYRSVTFNDIRTSKHVIDPTYPMKRFTSDIGIWTIRDKVTFDASIWFVL
jgi:Fe(3+) dicitrate transport protein